MSFSGTDNNQKLSTSQDTDLRLCWQMPPRLPPHSVQLYLSLKGERGHRVITQRFSRLFSSYTKQESTVGRNGCFVLTKLLGVPVVDADAAAPCFIALLAGKFDMVVFANSAAATVLAPPLFAPVLAPAHRAVSYKTLFGQQAADQSQKSFLRWAETMQQHNLGLRLHAARGPWPRSHSVYAAFDATHKKIRTPRLRQDF